MKSDQIPNTDATMTSRSQWSARKRPAGHTAGLFLASTSIQESKVRLIRFCRALHSAGVRHEAGHAVDI